MSYRKPVNDSHLTWMQEQQIFALWMLEGNLYGRAGGNYVPQYYSGAAIGYVIGGQWSTYRTRQIKNLIDLGWVEQTRMGRLRYYRLTIRAWEWVDNLLFEARNGRSRSGSQNTVDMFAAQEKKKPIKVNGQVVSYFDMTTMNFTPKED